MLKGREFELDKIRAQDIH